MLPPGWFYAVVAFCLVVLAGATVWGLASEDHWIVVEYESRGPTRLNKVLLNQRTGETCELIREGSSKEELGQHPFWVCNRPPKGGGSFFP
jgi:hypothetical protein